jgi:predicted glycoside hydrolase/deacetylase ChbG (UPF0249 family)
MIWGVADPGHAEEADVRFVVRADDMGSSHAANVACIQAYREGIARTVEVMVPCPWFNEAVEMLKENPKLDVGVHLTLTSEWESYKWGPVTASPSLTDKQGHFYPTTSQRPNFPPGTGFLNAKLNLAEVEKELRAQIELAKEKIPQVSHLTSHMGTPTATPELTAIVEKLSREYRLPLDLPGAKPAGGFRGSGTTPEQKEAALVAILENLKPGVWLFVEHPGLDTPEMRAIGHVGYRNVAADRDGVTKAFTSDKVKEAIRTRGIKLASYADLCGKSGD